MAPMMLNEESILTLFYLEKPSSATKKKYVKTSVHPFENSACSADACSMFLILFLRVAGLDENR
jgi:hypothetical protein